MPVETCMAGDLLLFVMALGKEGSASHWCTYCDTSSAKRKKGGKYRRAAVDFGEIEHTSRDT